MSIKLKSNLFAVILLSFIFSLVFYGCEKPNTLELSGIVESTQTDVNSEVAGKVIKLEKEEGSNVKQGDILAILDSSLQELAVKQQEAVIKAKQAKLDELKETLVKKGTESQAIKAAEADLEQSEIMLEKEKLIYSKYQVKAPVDGTLILNNVEAGDIINTGASVSTISDLDNLWIRVYIPQKYLKSITLNQQLDLRVKALGDVIVKGKIIYISIEAEYTPKNTETEEARENTVFKVKIKIMENVDKIKPGMTVDAILPLMQ